MALEVKFYKITDPIFCANKTVNNSNLIDTIEGNPIEAENILYPSFLIDYYPKFLDCNYCYIKDWGDRYYFCKAITENGGNIRINCSVDALTTYWKKNEIQTTPMTIVRSTSFGRPTYVPDALLPVDNSRTLPAKVMTFNTVHNTGKYVVWYDIMNTL